VAVGIKGATAGDDGKEQMVVKERGRRGVGADGN